MIYFCDGLGREIGPLHLPPMEPDFWAGLVNDRAVSSVDHEQEQLQSKPHEAADGVDEQKPRENEQHDCCDRNQIGGHEKMLA